MKIFLSHNWKDKILVEPFALRLADTFGQANVFYDSWSIQPGDGIIDKMNAGLGSADLFFFFVSANSLASKMVDLEWQNALMKASKGSLRLVPIRLDASLIPPILMQTAYLDLYTNGLEATLRQAVDLALGRNTFSPQFNGFSNFSVAVTPSDDEVLITVEAVHYMEPRCHFLVLTTDNDSETSVGAEGHPMFHQGFNKEVKLNDGRVMNAFYVGVSSALVPGFPFRIKMKSKKGHRPSFMEVMHQQNENRWASLAVVAKATSP